MEEEIIEDKPKQILVIRKDLKMRRGKEISQACHASNKIILENMHTLQMLVDNKFWKRELIFVDPKIEDLYEWSYNGKFTKIGVGVNSEQELKEIYQKAVAANILCSLIEDSGLTEFRGIPTLTCAAIGPAKSSIIDQITGELKLL